jgi:two-component system, NarL family, nitrate/nitrite response regulator NarL
MEPPVLNKKIKLIIADDHSLFIDGLKTMLSQLPEIDVILDASDGEELLRKLRLYYADLIILDIQMPRMNGIEAVKLIKMGFPDLKIIILSMHDELSYVRTLYELGVNGYLLKNTSREELFSAIRKIAAGGSYFSSELITSMISSPRGPEGGSLISQLTRREKEILMLIAQELKNQEIAEKLHISLETVHSHRKNLMRKLQVKNTAGLVRHALSMNVG